MLRHLCLPPSSCTYNSHIKNENVLAYLTAPGLVEVQGARAQGPHHVSVFSHMYDMCVPHSLFVSEESLFVDAIKLLVVLTADFT